MSGVVASRVVGGFVVSVPFEVAEEFVDALVVLGERLIGEVPPVFREVEAALWGEEEAAGAGAPALPVSSEVATTAAEERAESFLAYVAGQQGRRRRALRVWLDRYTEDFWAARARWEREWVWSLEDEFAQREGCAA